MLFTYNNKFCSKILVVSKILIKYTKKIFVIIKFFWVLMSLSKQKNFFPAPIGDKYTVLENKRS